MPTALTSLPWFHRIPLPDGTITPGVDDSASKLAAIRLPEDLTGKAVLDIGAWDGFFSFECELRGASRVLAVDSYSWGGGGWGNKGCFEVARRMLGSRVEDLNADLFDLSSHHIGRFDVVLFLGVLYHLKHPWRALEIVADLTAPGGLAIIETHTDLNEIGRPAMALYPTDELNRDGSNWCGPNRAAVEAMLRDVGFREVAAEALPHQRAVFHASK